MDFDHRRRHTSAMTIKLGQIMRVDLRQWEVFADHAVEDNVPYPGKLAWSTEGWKFYDGITKRWHPIDEAPRHAREVAAILESRRPKSPPAPVVVEPPKTVAVTPESTTELGADETALVHVNEADSDLVARNRQLERQVRVWQILFWCTTIITNLVTILF